MIPEDKANDPHLVLASKAGHTSEDHRGNIKFTNGTASGTVTQTDIKSEYNMPAIVSGAMLVMSEANVHARRIESVTETQNAVSFAFNNDGSQVTVTQTITTTEVELTDNGIVKNINQRSIVLTDRYLRETDKDGNVYLGTRFDGDVKYDQEHCVSLDKVSDKLGAAARNAGAYNRAQDAENRGLIQ